MASEEKPSELVPLVVLSEGEKVVRKEYPTQKFSLGSAAGMDLQVRGAGVPDKHPLLVPGKDGMYVYLRQGMAGTLEKDGRKLKIEDLIYFDLLPSKNGLFAVSVDPKTRVNLNFGPQKVTIGYGPKPQVVTEQKAPARVPVLKQKGRLQLRQQFRFAEIPEVPSEQKKLYTIFGVVAGIYIAVVGTLMWAAQFAPKPDPFEEPPEEIVAQFIAEPEPIPEPEVPEEEVVEEEEAVEEEEEAEVAEKEQEPEESPKTREEAKEEVQKLGLISMLSSEGGSARADVEAVTKSLENVFSAGALSTDPTEADKTLEKLENFGTGSGGIDSDIAGLKGVKRRTVTAKAEKVDNPVVQGEAAGDQRRSYAAIRQTMRRYMSTLRILYKRLLRQDPNVQGKITFAFTIKADGSVTNVKAIDSAFSKYPDFEKDLADRIERIRFEPIEKGDVVVQFPFIFTPSG